MLAAADKRVSFSKSYLSQFQDAYSGKMSDFSSWGVTPDLKLKPEITAPGGDIYSTLPGGLYGSMSGTSMASPHMAGAAVVMAQYITEELGGTDMTQQEITALSNKLLMSTAVPVKNKQSLPYSPRKQGAGLVQLGRATKAKAYLSSAEGGLPKAELGDSADGSFSFSFQANNLSTSEIQYEVGVTVLTEDTVKEDGKTYLAQSPRQMGADEVTVTAPSTVTLRASGTATVNVSLALTAKGKAALSKDFPNGIYIEGFVTLTPVNGGDTISLGLPFLGFYGDWSAAPIFDASVYDTDKSPAVYRTMLGLFGADGSGYYLGHNLYATDNDRFDKNYIAMSNKTPNYHVTAAMAMLRSADELTFSVTNESNAKVYEETLTNQSKTYYSSSQQSYHTPMAATGFTGYTPKLKFTPAKALPEGTYTYTVTATLNGKTEKETFPLTIDNQAPQVVKSEVVIQNGKRLWKVTVTDNHYVQAVCATLGSTPLTGWYAPNETEEGAESVVTFDLSDPAFDDLTQAKIGLVDYADNQTVSGYYDLTGGTVVDPEPTEPETEPVLASIKAPASIQPDAQLPVDFQLEKMKRVATVSFVFERDAALTGGTAEGKNGFTALGSIRWNGNKGILMLSYLQDGTRGGSLTQTALTDVARVVFKATAGNGTKLGIKLTGVTVTGFDEKGQAVTLLSNIKTPSLSIAVREGNSYDVNKDGTVDQLDITTCQRWYMADSKDSDWSNASVCDVNGDNKVDIEDMIGILQYLYQS